MKSLIEPTLHHLQAHEVLVVPNANLSSYARYVDAFVGYVLSLFKMYSSPVWCVRGPMNAEMY